MIRGQLPPVNNQQESRHYAIWVPFLEDSGEYNIEMFIPDGVEASTEAIYEISVKNFKRHEFKNKCCR